MLSLPHNRMKNKTRALHQPIRYNQGLNTILLPTEIRPHENWKYFVVDNMKLNNYCHYHGKQYHHYILCYYMFHCYHYSLHSGLFLAP